VVNPAIYGLIAMSATIVSGLLTYHIKESKSKRDDTKVVSEDFDGPSWPFPEE
jgi:hypothetical protein